MPCLRSLSVLRPLAGLALASSLFAACAGGGTADTGTGGNGSGGSSTGGENGTGGSSTGGSGTGGALGTGGGTGGSTSSGGTTGTGGVIGTGGTRATGGTPGTGGTASGGASGKGGSPATGGAGGKGTGGTTATGGTAGGAATGGTPGSGVCGGGTAQSSDITINEASLQQKITGFGVSSAWAGSYANPSDPDYLWSTTTGAGLSLLRIRYGDGLAIAQAAVKAGVTVWLTPWGMGSNGSPGGADTTMQSNANGCKVSVPVLTNPQDWANTLASYVQKLKTSGVPLYAVSAENEPDSCGINQTTSYSATQLATWIGGYLGPAMAPLGVKVMGPETQNACGFTSYYSAIQGDAAAWGAVNILASHEYGCGTLPSEPAIAAADKEYWETEVDTGTASGDSPGDGIASALLTAQTMHNDLTKANLNAWHYWWMYCSNNSGCLYDTGTKVWAKRLWAMGNFSRFVRPGWKRVATSGTSPSGVLVSAYINPANNALSIVAINSNTSSKSVSFYVSGNAPCSLTPYETSASKNLGQGSAVTVSGSRVTVTLSAQSVTTFVGTP